MGYILLPPAYIDNNLKNWHLFCADLDFLNNIITIKNTSECNNKDVLLKDTNIKEYLIKEKFNYYLLCNPRYLNNRIGSGYYYRNSSNSFFYSDDENIVKMLASLLENRVCSNCIGSLYGKEDTNIK
ncbi:MULTISPECIES: hypothetical protein [Brachyspira]|uniref:hypothetical protein n=1 Tax=Brachyspira TaxID=29521 RepID=UPI0012F4CFE8|nr:MULTISPECIES: hypothetical protein [Brachyspira]